MTSGNRPTLPKWQPLLNLTSRIPSNCGAIAQLGERVVRNDEAIGSIPISSTKKQKVNAGTTLTGL